MLETDTTGYDLKNKTGVSITRLELPAKINSKTLDLFLKQTKSKLPSYFEKLGVFIDVKEMRMSETFSKDLDIAIKKLEENNFIISGILNPKESQKDWIKETLKIAVFFETTAESSKKEFQPEIIEKEVFVEKEVFIEKEVFVDRPSKELTLQIHEGVIRGGNKIYAKNAHLLILGSVKPNAEIIADGNIFVLGKLEGRAFAGGENLDTAVVLAKEMFPSLISIAGNFKTFEEDSEYYGNNVIVSFNGDKNSLESKNF